LNVLYEERFGGPQSLALQVAASLRQRGLETIIVIPRGDAAFATLLREAQVAFRELDLVRLRKSRDPVVHARFVARFWPNVRVLRGLIREHEAKIVHTNGLMNLQAAIAARLEHVPLVWHLNDMESPRLLRTVFLPFVRRWADRIAVGARAIGRFYFPDTSGGEGRLHLVYPPVDPEKFNPGVDGSKVRAEFGIPDACPLIGTVANLGPGKGLEYLIEAAPRIKERFPTAKFILVGQWLENRRPYWLSLMRRREELGLARDVFFAGQRRDMPEVMRALTVYVHPSESEGCSVAVLEASASGLPVVATDVGGTSEAVENGVAGLLIEPRQPSQITAAVIRLLESPGLARQMGMAASARMRERFTLDACVREHMRVYSAALDRAAARRQGHHPTLRAAETRERSRNVS